MEMKEREQVGLIPKLEFSGRRIIARNIFKREKVQRRFLNSDMNCNDHSLICILQSGSLSDHGAV